MRSALLSLSLLMAGCQSPGLDDPIHYQIGVVHRAVTTSSPQAQLWFDRGLALTYGFNHEEAIVCFERAAEWDPSCAMAYWGKAYAIGPNYNNTEMTEETSQAAHAALVLAQQAQGHCSPVEQALIEALAQRYPTAQLAADRKPVEANYAEAMREVYAQFPDDDDVAALTGEALMMLRPWKLWSPEGEPAPETPEIRKLLEGALAKWPRHPALCHLYIHAMEAGPFADQAIPAAQTLESLTPGLGHLRHMPSHIYVWTGRYDDVVRTNVDAVEMDDAYVDHAGRENFYSLYRLHNYHFVAYGAMWEGRKALALEYSRRLVEEIPPGLLSAIPDLLDVFVATPYHVMVRFGLWNEILAEPEPSGDLFAARAVWRYARGVALASLGRTDEADQAMQEFLQAKEAVPGSRLLFNNPVKQILDVAEKVLAGEIEYRKGNHAPAYALLREAVSLDEQLNYDEPWGWMEPARHALGALLTAQGHHEEAVKVYRANLDRYPENGWALHGLAECLDKLGQFEAAAEARTRFKKAWARADVEIPGSCYCRIST